MTAETEIDFLSLWPIKPKKHLLQIQQYLHDHSYLRALLRISSQIFYLQNHKLYKETNETKVKAVFIKKKNIVNFTSNFWTWKFWNDLTNAQHTFMHAAKG